MPTGTVTLLFSDIEGSTVLLSRLGPEYAAVLSGQREVLRAAWGAHGGTEMGTEGDSFFVAFPTAPAAVAAAVQAQRGLAARDWPGGASVRVRMGIHTGNPGVHDGGYVGMDVHRAARIAGSAHGGQVVVSAATAELVGAALPPDVRLRDLGSFRLKDLPSAERLFQVTGAGPLDQFPPLKTLGSASSLPRPATQLVGRDGELTELVDLLGSAGVRLVTLTGPGGSGKTRLAIGVAQRLVDTVPDGVFFVPLAAVTTPEVMWTTIAEVLDVPPEARTPPAFFPHIAHRRALFVLDNLEQLHGADTVVADLLREAPHAVVIATTRRPLHLAAEHEHQVPPLDLPDEHADVISANASGAVQLFVQHARKVKPSFTLTPDNTPDVTALCRQLDGLPLAIELAAARSKLLSPRALLTRLAQALDIKEAGIERPTRQQTLRAAIDWSYDLLTPAQQAFFRRLGIFAGGADLDAITAITTDLDTGTDELETLTDLVDASLITINEDADGEPRVVLLETMRAYARDQLLTHDELDNTSRAHAEHYLKLSRQWSPHMFGEQRRSVRARFETEHDNIRAALDWALDTPAAPGAESNADDERIHIGVSLCAHTGEFWRSCSYSAAALVWLERAVARSAERPSHERAECLLQSGLWHSESGKQDGAYSRTHAAVDLLRQLGDCDTLPFALSLLARIEFERGNPEAASSLSQEAVSLAQDAADADTSSQSQLARVLGKSALLALNQGEYERALELELRVIELSRDLGRTTLRLSQQHNMACTLRAMGRHNDAQQVMLEIVPQILEFNEVNVLPELAEDYAAILSELGDARLAVQLLAAAEATRERLGEPRGSSQEAEITGSIAKARRELTETEWDAAWQAGWGTPIEKVLMDACTSRAAM
jgi:predicted ATPase/class 3 adenylate cyclase